MLSFAAMKIQIHRSSGRVGGDATIAGVFRQPRDQEQVGDGGGAELTDRTQCAVAQKAVGLDIVRAQFRTHQYNPRRVHSGLEL